MEISERQSDTVKSDTVKSDTEAHTELETERQLELASESSAAYGVSSGGRFIKKIVIHTGVVAFGLIVALAFVEFVFRMTIATGVPGNQWSDRPTMYYKHEASKTLQDYPYNPVKPEGTFRIAVLGDSFAFATLMQFDDAFPKKLERMLRLGDSVNRVAANRVEVVNYAVPGYSTQHEAGLMRRVLKEGADLILLQVTLNDPQLKPYVPTGITGNNEFGERTFSGKLGKVTTHWKSLGFALQRFHNSSTHRRYKNYYFSLFQSPRTWDSFELALRKISRAGKRRNVPVGVVLFPLFGLPIDDSYPFLPLHEKIKAVLDGLDVPLLDLFSTYKGLPLERIQLIPGKDFHPNEIGHRMAAEQIYKWLVSSSLLPPKFEIRDQYRTRLDIRSDSNDPIIVEDSDKRNGS